MIWVISHVSQININCARFTSISAREFANMRSSVPLHPVDKAEEDPEQERLVADYEETDDIDDVDPLLPDSDLLIERLKNELETELAGADAYERTIPGIFVWFRSVTVVGQSRIINRAIQDMGMGRYQWELFVLCGFGWFADK